MTLLEIINEAIIINEVIILSIKHHILVNELLAKS